MKRKINQNPGYVNAYLMAGLCRLDLKKRMKTGVMVVGGLTLVAAVAWPQIRMYDPGSGQNAAVVSRETLTPPNPLPFAPATGAAAAPKVTLVSPSISALVASLPNSAAPAPTLGTATVFVKIEDATPAITDLVLEMNKIKGLATQVYLNNAHPERLLADLRHYNPLAHFPVGLLFGLDVGGMLAAQEQVAGQNVIVYKDPAGKVRHYALPGEFYTFKSDVESVRNAVR
jgi:hypothetical protein